MPRQRSTRTGGQGLISRLAGAGLLLALALPAAAGQHAIAERAQAVLRFACARQVFDAAGTAASLPSGFALAAVEAGTAPGRPPRQHIELAGPHDTRATILVDAFPDGSRSITLTLDEAGRPRLQVLAQASGNGAGEACAIRDARRIDYGDTGSAESIVLLDAELDATTERIPVNPPVPDGSDPGGITVAHVDSGVNYLLPQIARSLARDGAGRILGGDFWDGDKRPFDIDTGRSPFFPLHHGTTVASLLLKEAPHIRLVPLRYPRPDMQLMGDVVRHADMSGARIVAMPMGSRDPADWTAFADAARAAPDVLFVVSAGNDGRDIDADPLYPASLRLPNMLVVTSADDFGRIARGSNWGAESVDLMVPAERIELTDHRGATVSASGSSYAVPRVAALAARLLERHPDWKVADLIVAISGYAAPGMDRGPARVKLGWIPDPRSLP